MSDEIFIFFKIQLVVLIMELADPIVCDTIEAQFH